MILRVADVCKVTNRQLIVLEMILISQQSIKASSRRPRCNAWLPRNRVRTRMRRWTSQLNGGLCKIIFCGAARRTRSPFDGVLAQPSRRRYEFVIFSGTIAAVEA